jgi:YggT family protein
MFAGILLLVADAVFSLVTLMLLARFFMQWLRVSFRNQIGQFVIATTDWLVRPTRRFVPALAGLDMASLLPAWLLQSLFALIELTLRGAPFGHSGGAVVLGLLGVGLVELVRLALYLVFGVVLISAVLSWVNPHAPAAFVFHGLAEPFLRPFRRFIPPIANVDLSPLVLLLVLQIVLMLIGGLRGAFAPLLFGA